jgi:hydrogenase expression/formation protein HypE
MNEAIKLGHGAGGRLSRALALRFAEAFSNPLLAPLADAAIVELAQTRIAFSTDSHVISPIFFPGGDIGRLAVFGTVNDLSVMGALPLYLSCALVLEEGFPLESLRRITDSLAGAAEEAGVKIITGDTKVVEHGKADGIFINTTGIGLISPDACLSDQPMQPGDAVIITGTVGDHAAAVLTAREGLRFESPLVSDCAPLSDLLPGLLRIFKNVKWMRDPTRGGVAAALNELADGASFGVELEECAIPIQPAVQSVCELLGFDPLHLANEGKALLIVGAEEAQAALKYLRGHALGRNAAVIGRLTEHSAGRVVLKTVIGGLRVLDMPAGELLPRIC